MLLLRSNQLTGPIPSWINFLNHLFFMDVSNNSLTGEIPLILMEMLMLKSIENAAHFDPGVFELPVYYNGPSFQYRVVTSFPTLLNLSQNYFTGVIPLEIGQLKVLAVLHFSFNMLSGQIPKSTCSLTSLQVMDLSSSNLTGEIPAPLNSPALPFRIQRFKQ
jgi:Leucine-rich repeat (LRR) protein